MKTIALLIQRIILAACLVTTTAKLSAQAPVFTYQGRLTDNGAAYTGNAEFQATLWNAPTAGSVVASNNPPQVIVTVNNGLFTLPLDFGATAFAAGDARWLQLEIRSIIGPFTALSPRQSVTPAPYAVTASHLAGTLPAAQLSGAILSDNLTGTYSGVVSFDNAGNNYTGSGAGLTGLNAAQLTTGTVPDARLAGNMARTNQVWLLSGNAGTTPGTHFLGTSDDQPLEFSVNGARVLRLEFHTNVEPFSSPSPNVIGGYFENEVDPGISGATVAGGGTNWFGPTSPQRVSGDFSTIGGGIGSEVQGDVATIAGGERGFIGPDAYNSFIGGGAWNSIHGADATIGGGRGNAIQTNAWSAVINGGADNVIETDAQRGAIGGGSGNRIRLNSQYATISGGSGNSIQGNGWYATIPGGVGNVAGAAYSFAAGALAKANHQGAFVWADSQGSSFSSTANNQFLVRAGGGVGIGTASPGAALDVRTTSSTGNAVRFGYSPSGAGNLIAGPSYVGIATEDLVTRLCIRQNGGSVGIATLTPGYTFEVNGTAGKPGGGSWSASSDVRLKKNIRTLSGALETVLALRGVRFEYLDPQAIHELPGERIGLIAQEVEAVLPDWVETGPEGYKRVTVRGFEALVVEALRELRQEQQGRQRQQEAVLAAMNRTFADELKRREAENADLKQRLARLEQLLEHILDGEAK